MFRRIAAFVLMAGAAHAACPTEQAASLPLTLWQEKLLLPVAINGSPQTLALDTGAGISTISTVVANAMDLPHDFDHAAQLGGVGGRESILNIGQIDTLDLDKLRLRNLTVPIADMAMKTRMGEPVGGLLGAEILHQYDVEIDIPAGRLTLWKPGSCGEVAPPWQDAPDPIPIDLDDGAHVLVPFKVQGVTLHGVLDTGSGALAITAGAAYRAGLTEESLAEDIQIRGTGVNDRGWTGHLHRFGDVRFGGIVFHGVPTEVIPSNVAMRNDALIGSDALIGLPLLEGARLFISYRSKTLFVQSGKAYGAD